MRSLLIRFVTISAAVLLYAGAAHAQVGSTTDIIMGKVTGPDGEPVVNARVEVTSNHHRSLCATYAQLTSTVIVFPCAHSTTASIVSSTELPPRPRSMNPDTRTGSGKSASQSARSSSGSPCSMNTPPPASARRFRHPSACGRC